MIAAAVTARSPRRRNDVGLVIHQIGYEQLSFWRNPQSAIFTFVFPVLFVTIMGALFGSVGRSSYFGGLSALQYYVPTIAALCVLGSCYGQLAVALAARRQNGILKRIRATPLPAWAYFVGLLAHCVLVSIADIALIVGVGRLYGVPFPSHWPAIALTLVLGAAAFCALGVAVASVISNAEAAPAVAQLVLFPLLFLSGTYLPIHSRLLSQVTGWLPIRPFNEALTGPLSRHTGADWRHLTVLAAWGVIGVIVVVRRFRWDPRPEGAVTLEPRPVCGRVTFSPRGAHLSPGHRPQGGCPPAVTAGIPSPAPPLLAGQPPAVRVVLRRTGRRRACLCHAPVHRAAGPPRMTGPCPAALATSLKAGALAANW